MARAVRLRHGISDNTPVVLLMGGGMGPTRMHQVVEQLSESNTPMHIVAIGGKDKRALRRLECVKVKAPVSLRVLGWTDEVAALMQAARLLVTKPGSLTISEAALCSLLRDDESTDAMALRSNKMARRTARREMCAWLLIFWRRSRKRRAG